MAEQLEDYPATLHARLLRDLRNPLTARVAAYCRFGKTQPKLFRQLDESLDGKSFGPAWIEKIERDKPVRVNRLVDALLVLEEKRRMHQKTKESVR